MVRQDMRRARHAQHLIAQYEHPSIARDYLPRGFGKRGGFFCPVCRQEARHQGHNPDRTKFVWFHDGRPWPCVRTVGEGG